MYCLLELEWFASTDAGRILQITSRCRGLTEQLQVFVVVVRQALAMLVDSTTQDGVGQRVALCFYFPAAVDELMTVLCCV